MVDRKDLANATSDLNVWNKIVQGIKTESKRGKMTMMILL